MELLVTNRNRRYWWVTVLSGVLIIAFGIYMICSPAASFAALSFLFGLIIFIVGVAELVRVTHERTVSGRRLHLIIGIVNIILGLVLMGHVAAAEVIIRIIVGIWFLIGGVSLVSFSHVAGRSWILILGGVIIALLGLMIIFSSVFGDTTIILVTAVAFIITGTFNVVLGYHMKKV